MVLVPGDPDDVGQVQMLEAWGSCSRRGDSPDLGRALQ